jgi:hypothetical protein
MKSRRGNPHQATIVAPEAMVHVVVDIVCGKPNTILKAIVVGRLFAALTF